MHAYFLRVQSFVLTAYFCTMRFHKRPREFAHLVSFNFFSLFFLNIQQSAKLVWKSSAGLAERVLKQHGRVLDRCPWRGTLAWTARTEYLAHTRAPKATNTGLQLACNARILVQNTYSDRVPAEVVCRCIGASETDNSILSKFGEL